MNLANMKKDLKVLIVKECEKDIGPEEITDDEILFGEDSKLQLDSLDALQISMALQEKYNIKLTDGKKIRKIMASVSSLAKYINEK